LLRDIEEDDEKEQNDRRIVAQGMRKQNIVGNIPNDGRV